MSNYKSWVVMFKRKCTFRSILRDIFIKCRCCLWINLDWSRISFLPVDALDPPAQVLPDVHGEGVIVQLVHLLQVLTVQHLQLAPLRHLLATSSSCIRTHFNLIRGKTGNYFCSKMLSCPQLTHFRGLNCRYSEQIDISDVYFSIGIRLPE